MVINDLILITFFDYQSLVTMAQRKTKYETDIQLTLEESRKKINKVLDKLDNLKEDEGGGN